MTSAGADPTAFRFSTAELPERDRLAIWREVFGRTVRTDYAPLSTGPVLFEAVGRNLSGVTVASCRKWSISARRTRELLSDGYDDLILCLVTEGTGIVSQRGRELTLGAGDAVLLSTAELAAANFPHRSRDVIIGIPRQALAAMVSDPEHALMRPVRRDAEALRLLRSYIRELDQGYALATPELQRLVVMHVHDLVALVIGATRDAGELARGRGLRAARLGEIIGEIHAGFDDPAFSPTRAALKLGLSPRYLRELLEETGQGFTERVLELRLQKARTMLGDPHNDRLKVTEIAFACGFNEVSYFNRCFRRRFGAAPNTFRGEDGKAGS